MSTLTINKTAVLTAFNNADPSGKQLLCNLFPDQQLSGKITDRVKTFEDACAVLGIQPADITMNLKCEALPKDIRSIQAYARLIIICRAVNEGWEPDWSNDNEYKYYPWFDLSSGSGLSYNVCDSDRSGSTVGSRLCLKNDELAKYVGKQFIAEYKEYMLISK